MRQLALFQHTLLDSAAYGIISTDSDGLVTSFNPAAEKLLGYRAAEVVGKQTPKLWHDPEEMAQRAKQLSDEFGGTVEPGFDVFRVRALRKFPEESDWMFIRKDGTRVPVLLSVTPLLGESGQLSGFVGMMRDLTEHKRMESALAASEREFRSLAENLPDNIVRYSKDARAIYVNPMLEKTLGDLAKERLGKTVREFHSNENSYDKYAQAIDDVLADGRDVELEMVSPAQDGKFGAVNQIRVIAEHDANGEVTGVLAIGRDITERKRSERELELLNTAVNASTESIFLINEAGRFEYVNDTACKSLGYSRDELQGMTPLDIDPDITPEVFKSLLLAVFDGTFKGVAESRHRTRDGRIYPVEIRGNRVEYGGGKYSLTITHDITERKKSEEQIRKLTQAVEQSPSSIMITDLQANIVYVNQTFTDNTGYTPEEVIGKNPRTLQSGKTSIQAYADMWAHLKKGETWRGEFINRRKDGSEYVESVMISPVRDVNGQIMNYLAIKEDITDRKRAAEREAYLAHFDQLTGLPNRTMLQNHFQYALSLAERGAENLAVVFLDLDHFKDVNDTLGHSVGDQLLVEVAKRLKSAMREADTVSRMGGDEFIFILPRTDENGAAHLVEKLIEIVSAPCQIEQHQLIVTPSIGIAIYPEDGTNMELLSQNADAAMYRAKQAGRNGYRFFTQAMQVHSARNLRLGNELRQAIARNQLQLKYQPQISVQDGHLVGAEALLRWFHPELGTIPPAEFIPIAEDIGLIIPIGEWVLRTAIRQMKTWLDQGFPPMVMAVNLSAVQFRFTKLPDTVSRILAEEGLSPEHLEFELTEAVAMDDPLAAIAVIDDLHARGIRMSIDDFGTGYSSLSYLKRFKVYKLKIDQSFVRDISDDPEDKAIVVAIINLASGLGIHTIAEGVETASQLAFLRLQGCDEVQGYYFSKPLTVEEFEAFVNRMQV